MAASLPSVLSQKQWDHLFQRDLYVKVSQKNSSVSESHRKVVTGHSLKYLIALNQPDKNIENQINELTHKKSDQIDSKFPPHDVTALHVAIMRGRKNVAKALIQAGALVDAKDKYGWTPLHHAALIANDLVEFLLKYGASPLEKTPLDGTYNDILKLTRGEQVHDREFIQVESFNTGLGKIEKKELSTRLGIDYSDECRWSKDCFFDFWTQIPNESGKRLSQQHIRANYEKSKHPPCPIVLKENLLLGSRQLDVVADDTICAFQRIGEYTGEIIKRDFKTHHSVNLREYGFTLEEDEKSVTSLDAEKLGNWTRYMNEGFPNVIGFDLFNTAGQRTRKIIFSADPEGIKKGESLLYDYSWVYHPLKWGRYTILGKEKMIAFFKDFQKNYEKLLEMNTTLFSDKRASPHVNADELIKYRSHEARVLYPFQTPMALIHLVFSQTIDPWEWQSLVEKEKTNPNSSLPVVFVEGNLYHKKVEELLWDLMVFDVCAEKLSESKIGFESMAKVRKFFLDGEGVSTVDQLIEKLKTLLNLFYQHQVSSKEKLTSNEIEIVVKEINKLI